MRTWLVVAALGLTLGVPAAWAKEAAPSTVGGGHMQHCPTAVTGAKTEIKDNKDSVEVVVTATDATKTDEIRKRAKHMVDAAKTDPTAVVHNGDGHGRGRRRRLQDHRQADQGGRLRVAEEGDALAPHGELRRRQEEGGAGQGGHAVAIRAAGQALAARADAVAAA